MTDVGSTENQGPESVILKVVMSKNISEFAVSIMTDSP